MNEIKSDFDLNALRLLVALDATRNVSRAAESLGMSQSGFSTALARLRQRLGDDLFVRVPGGMEPTARAQDIVEAAADVLSRLEGCLLEQPVFQPRSAQVGFQLAMADLAEVVFMPRLMAHLQREAPGVSVHCHAHGAELLRERLTAGKIDLALGYFPDLEAAGFFQQRLYNHTFACMVRKGHPVLAEGLNKANYQALGHAVVASPARSNQLMDQALERQRIRRRVAFSTSHHLSLAATIETTDLIATVPMATAHHFQRLGVVEVVALPFRPPVFSVNQYWHKRVNQEPRHAWLREQISGLFNPTLDVWLSLEQQLYGQIRMRGM